MAVKTNIKILILLTFFFSGTLSAQLSDSDVMKIDSLKNVIATAEHDSNVVNAYYAWDLMIYIDNPELDIELCEKIIKVCRKNLSKTLNAAENKFFKAYLAYNLCSASQNELILGNVEVAYSYIQECIELGALIGDNKALNNGFSIMSIYNEHIGRLDSAIIYTQKALDLSREANDTSRCAENERSMGTLYLAQGDLVQALKWKFKSLVTASTIKDSAALPAIYNDLGVVYSRMKDTVNCLKYSLLSLEIMEKFTVHIDEAAVLYHNISTYYVGLKDVKNAIKYLNKAKESHLGNDPRDTKFHLLITEADINLFLHNDSIVERLLLEALEIAVEVDRMRMLAEINGALGKFYLHKENYQQAIYHAEKTFEIIGDNLINSREVASKVLYKSYRETGDAVNALKMHEIYILARDSILDQEHQREQIQQGFRYEYDMQLAAETARNAENENVTIAKLDAKEQQSYFLYIGLALTLIFGLVIFSRFRVISKQKVIIQDQKLKVDEAFDELEVRNTEMLDSINYAKRIQSAILPPLDFVQEKLGESFVLYIPKDIVAGDFYWMQDVQSTDDGNETVLFAAADCTGHGVPGALVSVVCNNALNRAVFEFGIKDPGAILDKTRSIVTDEFGKSLEDVKDGMDIALISLEIPKGGNSTGVRSLKYAGANNPLWIIRNEEIIEIKADKQPIGNYQDIVPFNTHSINLEKGDSIYVFSDGYADQFGGDKGKKLKTANLKKLLLSLQHLPMKEQQSELANSFEQWKGDIEQLDDVCIIGLRV
jgi:serine phosphatase RsbU (regulator of sigma subunit)